MIDRLEDKFIGIFKGFTESRREFTAEVISPYKAEYNPLLGSFVLVSSSERSALLGRITDFRPVGAMVGDGAEDYLSYLYRMQHPVPEDLKELRLRYGIKVKLLGAIEQDAQGRLHYCPGVRSIPHLGAKVFTPNRTALEFICNARLEEEGDSAPIGHYSLGDKVLPVEVRFSFSRLLAKRTFIFARAGYGKSNLVKLMVARLYEGNPNAGMLIFDPEGEYAFQDVHGRPGLADVPRVRDRLVVFTDREPPKEYYKSFIADKVKLNLENIQAALVVDTFVREGGQESVYAYELRSSNLAKWQELVGYLYQEKDKPYSVLAKEVKEKLGIDKKQAEAVVRNLMPIIRRVHNPKSSLPHSILYYLAQGAVVVVDISLLSSGEGQRIAGLILKTVFDHNVAHLTSEDRESILPTVAVIEEAQTVLSEKNMQEDSPFVEWVKEGRKYGLGAILVTQQPGAISEKLLSQGDNFFALHLVSGVDLDALNRNNAHFSEDILAYILNEPIKGNVYFWSAPNQPYVISAKVLDFNEYVEEKRKGISEEASGPSFPHYWELKARLRDLISKILWEDPRVPVYTPVRDGEPIPGHGAVNLWNLRATVGERFFSQAHGLKPWMLTEFFSLDREGKPILRQKWAISLTPCQDVFQGVNLDNQKSGEYLLIKIDESKKGSEKELPDSRQIKVEQTNKNLEDLHMADTL